MSYTQAIDCDPTNPIYYSNRAQALHNLQRFSKAVEDADEAIKCDPGFTRAFCRKANALLA